VGARDRNSKSIMHGILKLLFAPDVPFRCLHGGVAKQKLNLFQFSSTTMAQAGASATKVMSCKIGYASVTGTSLHRIPNNIGSHTGFLSRSPLQNPPEYLSLDNSRQGETALHRAVVFDRPPDYKMIRFLLRKGADVNATRQYQDTPLHQAASLGLKEVARILVKDGAERERASWARRDSLAHGKLPGWLS